jgi:aminopeptidase N
LVEGKNTVSLSFQKKYNFANWKNDYNGIGLSRFVDPDDGEEYINTSWVADYCHHVFPCFDQLDIKAKWSLKAIVPEDWVIVSNELE